MDVQLHQAISPEIVITMGFPIDRIARTIPFANNDLSPAFEAKLYESLRGEQYYSYFLSIRGQASSCLLLSRHLAME